jgi:hypothetical protein
LVSAITVFVAMVSINYVKEKNKKSKLHASKLDDFDEIPEI